MRVEPWGGNRALRDADIEVAARGEQRRQDPARELELELAIGVVAEPKLEARAEDERQLLRRGADGRDACGERPADERRHRPDGSAHAAGNGLTDAQLDLRRQPDP